MWHPKNIYVVDDRKPTWISPGIEGSRKLFLSCGRNGNFANIRPWCRFSVSLYTEHVLCGCVFVHFDGILRWPIRAVKASRIWLRWLHLRSWEMWEVQRDELLPHYHGSDGRVLPVSFMAGIRVTISNQYGQVTLSWHVLSLKVVCPRPSNSKHKVITRSNTATNLQMVINGKSSFERCGQVVHSTNEWFKPNNWGELSV